ncbi:hypothetical protein IHE44_0011083 [Lamprotornis superbus]|uniref:Large ribosomal subunit protein mL50 n=1 Tax=Lamprotornis superbus TaxID=245042 RepID=A0A835NHS9_9PASS|nr:hypothetical protein IHE44_0011083 [Lamprotornis superbus]
MCEEDREVEADRAVPEKEERSEPSLICPPPRSRSYLPPEDLQSCLESHAREVFGPSLPEDWQQTPLQENRLKYRLLVRLAAELGHAVPNSQLHRMRRAGDVLAFYRTAVKDGTKIDELAAAELPPNLKIIWQKDSYSKRETEHLTTMLNVAAHGAKALNSPGLQQAFLKSSPDSRLQEEEGRSPLAEDTACCASTGVKRGGQQAGAQQAVPPGSTITSRAWGFLPQEAGKELLVWFHQIAILTEETLDMHLKSVGVLEVVGEQNSPSHDDELKIKHSHREALVAF